ncbi:SMP-30/gluconolactonase/LRE family protein [Microbacterium sp. NPDC056044]|uniref:SMP-30/gluconolactonase/LRE family protein n=1 Tax=Microbacterium sp. NPDC056044 TaxID=3345690 RepID=UPI0035DCA096
MHEVVQDYAAEQIATGFSWTECPRWHDGAFYFSDMYAARVIRVETDGSWSVFADFSERVGLDGARVVTVGIGFLPDGRLIANSMFERVVLVWDGESTEVYADLRPFAPGPVNDMVVDAEGRAYVTQLGYDLWKKEEPVQTAILLVDTDGSVRELREAGLYTAPNGITISADGRTVVTAEAPEKRLIAFDRAADGILSAPRVFAELDLLPDGVCFDADGAVWAAQPGGGAAIRIVEGGEITARVTVDPERGGRTTACGLGGEDRRTLYVCCGFEVWDFDASVAGAQGSIWAAEVPVGAGESRP